MAERWDHDSWRESKDTAWRAGCRWLQSWWRSERLDRDPGPHKAGKPDRLVASMLPLEVELGDNLLSDEAVMATRRRLAQPRGAGMIDPDRLARNLLGSQPLCFSLFGHLERHPEVLVAWLRSLGIEADAVVDVRLEWAPDRKDHFGGGSAFDALVVYERGLTTGFVGVECKYAENLADQRINPRDPYVDFTRTSGHWRSGAVERLRANETVQLWLNTLLAQSCVDQREEGWSEGSVVMLACGADRPAFEAAVTVRTDLDEPSTWLTWSSYEHLVDLAAQQPSTADWAARFQARYLDFTPVAHLLGSDDPRITHGPLAENGDPEAIARLRAVADHTMMMITRVFGEGSILEQVYEGHLDDAPSVEIATLAERLGELAEAARVARIVAAPVWDQLEEEVP